MSLVCALCVIPRPEIVVVAGDREGTLLPPVVEVNGGNFREPAGQRAGTRRAVDGSQCSEA